MKFNNIRATIFTVCLCVCMIAFSGCSERINTPNEMPSGDSSVESSDDGSSESGETSADSTSSESESSSSQASSNNEYQEIHLDHEYLETVEKDELYVIICLRMDEEALRDEFEEKNPGLIGNDNLYYYYWPRYLGAYVEQIAEDFLTDYDIAFEDVRVSRVIAYIKGYFDKSVVSSMLNDLRVESITYYPGGDLLSNLVEM